MQFSVKYRPKVFAEIVGHEYIVVALKNSIILNRVPNALIFAGPRGIGKTSIARIFAKALNCPNFPTLKDACNECSSCINIQEKKALDYIEIDAASNRGIDEIRNLEKIISLRNFALQYKVIVLDESHMITEQAWNALLKTIEEPPANIKIILATTDVDKLPLTILSRCQKFDFNPLPKKYVVENLKKICMEEKIPFAESVLDKIAHYTGGSLRDAQVLLEQIYIASGALTDVNQLFNVLGTCREEELATLFDCIIDGDSAGVFKWIDTNLPKIYNMHAFCDELLDYADKLITQKYIDKPIEGSNLYQFKIKSQVDRINIDKLLILARILLELKSKLYYFDNPQLLIKTFLLKTANIDHFISIEKFEISGIEGVSANKEESSETISKEGEIVEGEYEKVEKAMPHSQTHESQSPNNIENIWLNILMEVKKKHMLTFNVLKSMRLLEVTDKFVKLGYTTKNNEAHHFNKEKNIEYLKNAIQKVMGQRLEIIFEVMDSKIMEELLQNEAFSRFYNVFRGKVEIE
ncbi:MAG: DNA polymerase III subunit gamma/tau [Planctomycetota bacterium]